MQDEEHGWPTLLEEFADYQDFAVSVALASDGRFLAIGGIEVGISIWDRKKDGWEQSELLPQKGVRTMAFSPDGRSLAAASHGSTQVVVWDRTERREKMILTSHLPVLSLAFSPDGRYLASGERGDRPSIYVWDLETGHARLVLGGVVGPGHRGRVFSGRGHPGHGCAMYENGGSALGHELRRVVRRVIAEEAFARYDFGSLSRRMVDEPAAAGNDGTICLWSVATGEPRAVLDGGSIRLNHVVFSQDGRVLIASGSGDNDVRFWELSETRLTRTGYPASDIQAQAPPDRIAHQPLIHGMNKCLERVAVGQVAEPAAAWLADPAGGGGGLPVIRAVSQQEVNTSLVVGRRMLLIGDKKGTDTAGDRMGRIDDLDLKPLKGPMADVPTSHQVEIRAIGGIQSHRVVQVEEAASSLHKRDDCPFLLGRHPDEMRAPVALRAHQAVAEDHEELDLRQAPAPDRAFTSSVKYEITPAA